MSATSEAPPFIARFERFAQVGSTNDVVGSWLRAGEPDVCLAVADEQTAGRGREGRTWTAPPGAALLLSLGFRPTWLEPSRVWQLAGSVSIAMAEAGEQVAELAPKTIRLKWPNDLVVETNAGIRKIAGVLGETDGLGSSHPIAVVGIGLNADWSGADFPHDLADTMTSLREVAGRPIDRDQLLDAFLVRLDVRLRALRLGSFDALGWSGRQVTNGRLVRVEGPSGSAELVRALRTDALTGALVVQDPDDQAAPRELYTGDIVHVRLEPQPRASGERV
ncbi:MAG TPA: biotin--[acetyl-CoA-carboxylase] ligase [Candidatus Limnocylindrales bacterium]|nr:biotin--[acetyl-CoA-carboxylase] ligase [Candidatus Limnocylindrales bacterium]